MKERRIHRVFVTGASGFIGSALVQYLVQQNIEVHCLIHKTPLMAEHANIKVIPGNLFNFKWEVLAELNPDVIFHFGRTPGNTKRERSLVSERNATSNQSLLSWLKRHPKPPLLVFGSSNLVYGDRGNEWVNESSDINPISFQREYFKAEEPVLEHLRLKKSPVIVVRPPWIYGEGSWFKWFYWQHIQNKNSIPLYGNGENQMSLIHVDDCAGLICHAAKYGDAGSIYNITGHEPISQIAFADHLQELVKLPVKKYSAGRLRLRLGKAAYEALTFSLRSNSSHELMQNYGYKYPEIRSGLQALVNQIQQGY